MPITQPTYPSSIENLVNHVGAYTDSSFTTHTADTTAVHGIANTAVVELNTNKGQPSGYLGLQSNAKATPGDLGTGTPSSTNFLRGDGTWAVPAGGGGGSGHIIQSDGIAFTQRAELNFTGAAVVSDDAGADSTIVHIPEWIPENPFETLVRRSGVISSSLPRRARKEAAPGGYHTSGQMNLVLIPIEPGRLITGFRVYNATTAASGLTQLWGALIAYNATMTNATILRKTNNKADPGGDNITTIGTNSAVDFVFATSYTTVDWELLYFGININNSGGSQPSLTVSADSHSGPLTQAPVMSGKTQTGLTDPASFTAITSFSGDRALLYIEISGT